MRNHVCFPNKNWRIKYHIILRFSIALYLFIFISVKLSQQPPIDYLSTINLSATSIVEHFESLSLRSAIAIAAPITPDPDPQFVLAGSEDLQPTLETIKSAPVTVDPATLGSVTSVTIGNRVWLDSNGNGIQNAGEAGVEGITVILLATNSTINNTPIIDATGNPVAPAITDDEGKYFFENLLPGDYQIQIVLETLPVHHIVTQPNVTSHWQPANSEKFDSDIDPITGLSDPTGPLMVGDEHYMLDLGILPVPAVEVGDRVWYDDNGDGLQSEDEDGVQGVAVAIFTEDGLSVTDLGSNPVEPTVTDKNGKYLFANLPPDSYYIEFDLTTLPKDYIVNMPDSTLPQPLASSPQPPTTTYQLPTGFLSAGSIIDHLDMGIVLPQPIEIGNRVWYDNDVDGVQDSPSDEPGVHGVEVIIFNADGTPVTDLAGLPVGRELTDSNGNYLFDNLWPGNYYVQFDLASLPPDYIVTLQDATNNQQPIASNQSPTANDQTDSDASPNDGRTPPTGFLPSGSVYHDLDLGIYKPSLHLAGIDVAPTAIQLISLTATEIDTGVVVEWATSTEISSFGFQILRSPTGDLASAAKITEHMVLAHGSNGVYEFIDVTARTGQVYNYWLVELQNDQTVSHYGPIQVVLERSSVDGFTLFLPLIEK